MSEPVVFTQAQAQRIWAAVRQMEQSGRREAGYDRIRPTTTRAENIYLYNPSLDEVIPPYAALGISQALNQDGFPAAYSMTENGVVFRVSAAGPASDVVLFNSGSPIAPGEMGVAQAGNLVICRFQGRVPAPFATGVRPTQPNANEPIVNPGVFACVPPLSALGSAVDEYTLAYYDNVGPELNIDSREITRPIVRIVGEVQKFDNFRGPAIAEETQLSEEPQFYGSKVPQKGQRDDLIRYCVAERIDADETPVFAYLRVRKEDIEVDEFTGGVSLSVRARLLATDNIYEIGPGLSYEGEEGFPVRAVFPYDPREWFKNLGSPFALSTIDTRFLFAMRTYEGNFGTVYPIDNDPDPSGIELNFPLGPSIGGIGRNKAFFVLTPPPPFNCNAVKACLQDEEFEFCDLVAACLDDEDFNEFLCEKVRECLDLEENEDIDDRIDQRLQQLCTCDTFIDGVSIVGNDWVFTTNEICYVACPDGGGGAGANIVIEGTDCPEDDPGEPEP
jgi:hypothetical protein